MFAKDIVHFDIQALSKDSTVGEAKSLFYSNKVSELAVVNSQNEFIGILKEDAILHIPQSSLDTTIEDIELIKVFAKSDQHIYEVFETFATQSLSIVPIVNNQNIYIGAITINSLITYISTITGFIKKGAVIIITLQKKDYSLSQICQIIESNNAKIVSLFTNEIADNSLELIIKLNIEDITSIMQTFERYNYHIETLYAHTEILDVFLQSRIENLMSYLNV